MPQKTPAYIACAAALGGDVQQLVIEQASVAANGVPTRRPSRRVQLLPHGNFAARDGRPYGMQVQVMGADGQATTKTVSVRAWVLDNEQGYRLARTLNERHNPAYQPSGAKKPASFGFDYEHQSIKAATNGQPAPRSGSGTQFDWVYDEGLYITDVMWTPAATQAILDGEYAYVSPVLFFDPDTGVVLDIFNAALVHTPALQELAGLQVSTADLSARMFMLGSANQPLEDHNVTLLQQLAAKLGLPQDATEAAALSAVDGLNAKLSAACDGLGLDAKQADATAITAALGAATTGKAVATALGASLGLDAAVLTDPTKASAAVAALKATTGHADAASQAIAALSAEVASLKQAQAEAALSALVDQGLSEGKLVPTMVPWAKGAGVAGLSAFLQNAPVIAPPQAMSQGGAAAQPPSGAAALGAEASAIAAQLGLTTADLA